jgi:hypothetical protein
MSPQKLCCFLSTLSVQRVDWRTHPVGRGQQSVSTRLRAVYDWELTWRVASWAGLGTQPTSKSSWGSCNERAVVRACKRPDSDTASAATIGPPQWHFYITTPAHHHMKEISSFSDLVLSYFVWCSRLARGLAAPTVPPQVPEILAAVVHNVKTSRSL